MKQMKYILVSLMAAMTLTACDRDGDTITTSGAQPVVLSGFGDVVFN